MRKLCLAAMLILFSSYLIGCMTTITGTTQSVFVDVANAHGANCKGIDKKGRVYNWPNTPSETTVVTADGPLTFTCEKKGFKKLVHIFEPILVFTTFGQDLFYASMGITVLPGVGYPERATLLMEPEESASLATKKEYLDAKNKLAIETKKQAEERYKSHPMRNWPLSK